MQYHAFGNRHAHKGQGEGDHSYHSGRIPQRNKEVQLIRERIDLMPHHP